MTAATLDRDYRGQLFGVRRSVRYHLRRRGFFERVRGAAILGIAASAMAALGWAPVAAAAILALALLGLAADSTRKARRHGDLARRFIALERRLVEIGAAPTRAALVESIRERLDIEADEPPIRRILDTLCHNELWRAMGYPESEMVPVSFLQRLFANYFDFRFDAAVPSRKVEA